MTLAQGDKLIGKTIGNFEIGISLVLEQKKDIGLG